jgi:hypothetical protein
MAKNELKQRAADSRHAPSYGGLSLSLEFSLFDSANMLSTQVDNAERWLPVSIT